MIFNIYIHSAQSIKQNVSGAVKLSTFEHSVRLSHDMVVRDETCMASAAAQHRTIGADVCYHWVYENHIQQCTSMEFWFENSVLGIEKIVKGNLL